jgi:hypothetical protein
METEKKQDEQNDPISQAENEGIKENFKPRDLKKTIMIAAVFFVGILIGAGVFAGFYEWKIKKEAEKKIDQSLDDLPEIYSEKQQDVLLEQPEEKENVNTFQLVDDTYTIRKGDIEWQSPVDLGDLGLIKKDVYEDRGGLLPGIKYIKVGEIKKGKYASSDMLVISSWISE